MAMPVEFYPLTVVLFSLLALLTAAEDGCSKFKVFKLPQNNELMKEMPDLCEKVYDGTGEFDCHKFQEQDFNRTLLPFVPKTGGIFKPSNIVLNPLLSEQALRGKQWWWPGLDITWESPEIDNSKKDLEGFLLVYEWKGSNAGKRCKLIKLNTTGYTSSCDQYTCSNFRFSYNLERVAFNTTLTAKIYSVPIQSKQHCQEAEITTANIMDVKNGNPYQWTPSVSLGKGAKPGQLELFFTLSPPNYNFTQFQVVLERKKTASDTDIDFADIEETTVNITIYATKLADENQQFDKITFNNLEADEYRVRMQAYDPNPSWEPEKCLCYKRDVNRPYGKDCQMNCIAIISSWFNLTEGLED